MSDPDISDILEEWPYDPDRNARIVTNADGSQKLQIRLRLGLLQMELDGRPDAQRPYGFDTVLEYQRNSLDEYRDEHGTDEGFVIDHDAWEELNSEGVLFYERYVVLFQLGDYDRTARDTARNLGMFDLVRQYAERPEDVTALEQYRPYLIRMNAAALAMQHMQNDRPDDARDTLRRGIRQLDELEMVHTSVFQVELDRARSMLEGMLDDIKADKATPSELDTLRGELARAIREERYEDAASIRDRIRRISEPGSEGMPEG
ncbi:MAG: UvrB/UvrC motif-containing protein [Verrucomicrobia bacterium]|nr:UvrB/UvrC motif-containing protein [Verrucomicrobiota bacterium]